MNSIEQFPEKRSKMIVPYVIMACIAIVFITVAILNNMVATQYQEAQQNANPISTPVSTPVSYIEPTIQTSSDSQVFTSNLGRFSITLPKDIFVTEKPERDYSGSVLGEVVFTLQKYHDAQPGETTMGQLVISYAKPSIPGKGGACPPNGFKDEIIAGQSVGVCEEEGGFSAAYFRNPNQSIEYTLGVYNLNSEQTKMFSDAVRNSLTFF